MKCGICETERAPIIDTINEVPICELCKDWDKQINFNFLPTRLQVSIAMSVIAQLSNRILELEKICMRKITPTDQKYPN